MQRKKLKEICVEIISGGTPSTSEKQFWDGDIPWITSADIDDSFNITPRKFITGTAKNKILPANNILIVSRVGLGKIARNKIPIAFSQDLQGIVLKEGFHVPYLIQALSIQVQKFKDIGRGATIKGVTKGDLENLEIPIPDIVTQRQIASILEAADLARKQRKAAIALTEQFLQSSFLHLFGEPVKNEKGWDKFQVKALSKKYSDGPFGSNLKSEHYSPTGILVIRLENIGVNEFKSASKSFITSEHFNRMKKYSCYPGDVIIGTMGDPNLRACILPSEIDVAINKADCVLFRPDKTKILAEYFAHLVNLPSFVSSVSNLVLGQTRGRISMGRLSTVEIPVPPLSLQQLFASIVADAERLRQRQAESSRELEQLFSALLQKYFGSEAAPYRESLTEVLPLTAEKEAVYLN